MKAFPIDHLVDANRFELFKCYMVGYVAKYDTLIHNECFWQYFKISL